MSADLCPSPIPPWHRPTQSPQVETFTEDNDGGTLSLTMDVSYLNTSTLKEAPTDPYVVALPDGNYKRQSKRIYIPKELLDTSAPWKVTGTFVGFGWLTFRGSEGGAAMSAVLEWDGSGWHLVGGNASPEN